MNQFLFRGHKVRYTETGQGEPLVFLHNGGNDHRIWDYQVAHFAQARRVLALDHLGFGASDKPRVDYTLPLYTDMVSTFVDQLGPEPVDLVGHCLGGAMALQYTLQNPQRVRSLILFHVATEQTLLAGPLASTYLFLARHPLLRHPYIWWLDRRGMSRKETAASVASQFGEGVVDDPAFADYLHKLYNSEGQLRTLYHMLSTWESFRALDEFERPDALPPIYLLWGRSNHILPIASGEAFCRRLRPDRFEVFEGCGHLLMRERPAEINQRIAAFQAQAGRPREVALAPAS
jgi:pimeloyl-ACP methyl ester carboxylesterase